MRQMFSGHNIAQISEELETSVSTVNLHIRAICSKAACRIGTSSSFTFFSTRDAY